jgi:hypothetical protein
VLRWLPAEDNRDNGGSAGRQRLAGDVAAGDGELAVVYRKVAESRL